MKKKILITSLFATLMLLVPMTSVVGESYVNNDCGCNVVNSYDLSRFKLLMFRLKVVTNILLLRFGDIPEVKEQCHEILDVINSNSLWDFPIICGILESILNRLNNIVIILEDLVEKYKDNPIIIGILACFIIPIDMIGYYVLLLGAGFDCNMPNP